jgi:DNA-3-methyladenine glycosylase II
MTTVVLPVSGPFSLHASIRFLEGFAPARYRPTGDAVLRLAFPVEGEGTPAGVAV